jgi:hypothetical protein
MSTFHYYIDINSWVKYLDRLKSKTRYVLIVSRPKMGKRHWRAHCSYKAVKSYFSDWEEAGMVDNVSQEGDPSPRNLFSVLFKSPVLERIALKDIDTSRAVSPIYPAMKDLAKRARDNDNPFTTIYYEQVLQSHEGKWAKRVIEKYVLKKFNMMIDVKENGIKDPLIINRAGVLLDGGHRFAILDALGYESLIARRTF